MSELFDGHPFEADLSDVGAGENIEITAGGAVVATVYGWEAFPCVDRDDFDADTADSWRDGAARLFAAAPDLLAACEALLTRLIDRCPRGREGEILTNAHDSKAIWAARAAIKKARGD